MSRRVRRARRSGSHDRPFGLVPSGADEGTDAVVCRLCGKTYRAITATHLRMRHDATGVRPIRDYKRRFKLVSAWALDLRRNHREIRIAKVKREGRRWTKRRVVREIRSARSERPTTFSRVPSGLYAAAQRVFGSWRAATEASGVRAGPHRSTPLWPRSRVRAAILDRQRRGVSIAPVVVLREAGTLYRAAVRRYGAWHRAVRAAGIDPATYKGPTKWTRVRVRAWVEERVAKGMSIRMSDVPGGLYNRVRADTGLLWPAFVKSLGHKFDGPPPKRRWSRDAVVAAIRARARAGLALTAFTVQKDQQSLKHAARNYFGSWDLALRAAGFTPRPLRRDWDEPGTLAAIRARQEDGGDMSESVVAVEDERLFAAATARFGSWKAALAKARRRPRVRSKVGSPSGAGRDVSPPPPNA